MIFKESNWTKLKEHLKIKGNHDPAGFFYRPRRVYFPSFFSEERGMLSTVDSIITVGEIIVPCSLPKYGIYFSTEKFQTEKAACLKVTLQEQNGNMLTYFYGAIEHIKLRTLL
jgi:hypothetical protein